MTFQQAEEQGFISCLRCIFPKHETLTLEDLRERQRKRMKTARAAATPEQKAKDAERKRKARAAKQQPLEQK